MGKKSRRPNRNKPKDIPAAASTAVAATGVATDQLLQLRDTFNQRCVSQDWEGVLTLESRMAAIAKKVESSHPSQSGMIYHNLGQAHRFSGREGGMEQAIVYYQKQAEMAKKAGNNSMVTESVLCRAECYVKIVRVDEAMDLHKSLCEEIGKESLDPNTILRFAEIFRKNSELSRALEILEHHLDVIERSWDEPMQRKALLQIASLYQDNNDYRTSNVYYERLLSLAKDAKDQKLEAMTFNGLGNNYGHIGEFGIAMECLEQGLEICSEMGKRYGQARGYAYMGDLLVAQDGREKEAIEMFQKACGILEEGDHPATLSMTFCKLGQAYSGIGAWDDAITSMQKSKVIAQSIKDAKMSYEWKVTADQALGKTYLEQYYTDVSLVGFPERKDELIRKALFSSEKAEKYYSSVGRTWSGSFLDLAQEHCFLGDTEKAHIALKEYLDATVKLGPSHCQTCLQICEKDAHMEKCSICKVARYCSATHQLQAWKKGRLCHKVMCPLLKSWRKMNPPGKAAAAAVSYHELFNNFFERVLVSKPK